MWINRVVMVMVVISIAKGLRNFFAIDRMGLFIFFGLVGDGVWGRWRGRLVYFGSRVDFLESCCKEVNH